MNDILAIRFQEEIDPKGALPGDQIPYHILGTFLASLMDDVKTVGLISYEKLAQSVLPVLYCTHCRVRE